MRGGYIGSDIGGVPRIPEPATEGAGLALGVATVTGVGESIPGPRLHVTSTEVLEKPVNVVMAESIWNLNKPGNVRDLNESLFRAIFNE